MDRGIYYNKNNEIVYCGNRKLKDPEELTWVNVHENNWLEELRQFDVFSSIWDGEKIIENPELTTKKIEIIAEKQKKIEIEDEKKKSGLMEKSKNELKNFVDDFVKPEDDIQMQINGLKKIIKDLILFI